MRLYRVDGGGRVFHVSRSSMKRLVWAWRSAAGGSEMRRESTYCASSQYRVRLAISGEAFVPMGRPITWWRMVPSPAWRNVLSTMNVNMSSISAMVRDLVVRSLVHLKGAVVDLSSGYGVRYMVVGRRRLAGVREAS